MKRKKQSKKFYDQEIDWTREILEEINKDKKSKALIAKKIRQNSFLEVFGFVYQAALEQETTFESAFKLAYKEALKETLYGT